MPSAASPPAVGPVTASAMPLTPSFAVCFWSRTVTLTSATARGCVVPLARCGCSRVRGREPGAAFADPVADNVNRAEPAVGQMTVLDWSFAARAVAARSSASDLLTIFAVFLSTSMVNGVTLSECAFTCGRPSGSALAANAIGVNSPGMRVKATRADPRRTPRPRLGLWPLAVLARVNPII